MQSDDPEGRDEKPALPPKLLRFSGEDITPLESVASPGDRESFIKRKRVGSGLSKKTWSKKPWSKKWYQPVEMKQLDSGSEEIFFKTSDDGFPSQEEMPPPKAFHKTQRYLGLNLGNWRMPARHFSIFSALFLVVFLPLWFVVQTHLETGGSDLPFDYDCYGDGSWTFVGISFRFGHFDYGSAKALDLAWNWIVGRGVQGILTLLAYRVFSDALLRTAELTPISFELYASLGLYSTKPELLWQLVKGLPKYGNWRVKLILIWLFVSTIYLVSFPSLLDACSGYEASQDSFFQWPNASIQNSEGLRSLFPLETANTSIVSSQIACAAWYEEASEASIDQVTMRKATNVTFFIYPPSNVSTYSSSYSSPYSSSYSAGRAGYDTAYQQTVNQCYNFSQSRANVSGYNQVEQIQTRIYNWANPIVNASWWDHFYQYPSQGEYPYWSEWGFYPSNKDNFICNTKSNEYQWGFSYEWLFVVSIVNSIWMIGLWILWVDCDTNSEFCRKGRRLGLWRAIADISEAMREELGPNICAYSEAELANALKNKPPVKYYSRNGTETEPGHIGLSSRPSGRLRLRWNHEYGENS